MMVDPRFSCRTCFSCNTQATNVCSQMGFIGLHSSGGGGFAEKVAVLPHMIYPLPDSVRLEDAALIEPLAVGRHALTMTGITDWSKLTVLVVGGGPVGQSVLFNLRAQGVQQVFLSEPTAKRQEHCQKLADYVFDPTQPKISVPAECRKLTRGEGVDVVFDCAGIERGMQDGMDALRPRGTFMNVAGWEQKFVMPMKFFMYKELTVKTTLAYDDWDFAETVREFVAGELRGCFHARAM